jgi:hypothetical protein
MPMVNERLMKLCKALLFLITASFGLRLPAQTTATSLSDSILDRQIEDTIRREMHINDPIKLIGRNYFSGEHYYLFIDYNKYSSFHSKDTLWRSDTGTVTFDSSVIDRKTIARIKKKLPKDLITDWVQVFRYKGTFYLYDGCEYEFAMGITDSLVKDYTMEGTNYNKIRSVYQHRGITSICTATDTLTFEPVDPVNSVYLIRSLCQYFIPIGKINNLPIIVADCQDEDGITLEYDQPDCK